MTLALIALTLIAIPFIVGAVLVWIEPADGSEWRS